MRATNWASTPLGEPSSWPVELQTLVAVMLGSSQPMFLAWGPERCWLYNDAYVPMLGEQASTCARPARVQVWPEVFEDALAPMFETVFPGGNARTSISRSTGGAVRRRRISASLTRRSGWREVQSRAWETTGKVQSERRAATAVVALAESEARYRSLFESMGEGVCVIEAVWEPGQPTDFRYVAAAFESATGGRSVVGRTIGELFPEEPREWFDIYDRVVDTGEAVRFERGLLSAGTVLDIYAYRLAEYGPGGRNGSGWYFRTSPSASGRKTNRRT